MFLRCLETVKQKAAAVKPHPATHGKYYRCWRKLTLFDRDG